MRACCAGSGATASSVAKRHIAVCFDGSIFSSSLRIDKFDGALLNEHAGTTAPVASHPFTGFREKLLSCSLRPSRWVQGCLLHIGRTSYLSVGPSVFVVFICRHVSTDSTRYVEPATASQPFHLISPTNQFFKCLPPIATEWSLLPITRRTCDRTIRFTGPARAQSYIREHLLRRLRCNR